MRFLKGYRTTLAKFAAAAVVLGAGGIVAYADDTMPPPPGLLQQAMGAGFQSAGYTLRGYAEGGYIFSTQSPSSTYLGPGILFNDKSEDVTLDQLSVVFSRSVTRERDQFDVGFIVQGIFGSDAQFTQANGTNIYGSRYANDFSTRSLPTIPYPAPFTQIPPGLVQTGFGLRNGGQPDPQNQFDLLQAAVTLAFPVGNGLTITAGKFVTPWGLETVDPTLSPLYSHSFIYALSTPKTLTGITVGARINQHLTVIGGVVMGWDQSLRDNNDIPSAVGQISYQIDPDWDVALSGIVGAEQTDNRADYRTVIDVTSHYRVSSETALGIEAVAGYEPDTGSDYRPGAHVVPGGFTVINVLSATGQDAFWGGAAGYLEQKLDEKGEYLLILRGEFFDDRDGGHGLATEVSSATVGLKIQPFLGDRIGGGLSIRPEIRWDYAGDDIFDDNTHNSQISLGVDVIYAF